MKNISVKDNFWEELTKKTNKNELENYLLTKLGEPNNPTQQNLYAEISKKITSYYCQPLSQATTVYSLLGAVSKISQKIRKTGKNRGQNKYLVELTSGETLQALAENLVPEKWTQLENSSLLGKNWVFKYKIWITNKQLLDFQLATQTSQPTLLPKPIKPKRFKKPSKTTNGTDVG